MLQKSFSDNYSNKSARGLNKTDPNSQPIVGAFVQLYYFIIGAGAIPVRLILRQNFGERSITPMAWAVSLLMHIWYVFKYIVFFSAMSGIGYLYFDDQMNIVTNNHIALIVLIFFINGFTIYLYEIFYRSSKSHFSSIILKGKHNKLNMYSYYRGDGKYFRKKMGQEVKTFLGNFVVDDQIMRMIVEPRKVFWAGIKIFLFFLILAFPFIFFFSSVYLKILAVLLLSFSGTGFIISLSAICLFLEEFGLYKRIRDSAYDIIDGEKDLELILRTKREIQSDKRINEKSFVLNKKYPIVKIVKK